jgi:hypothetical protein
MGVNQKAEDWKRVQDELPEHAEVITEISRLFGRPAEVKVIKDDEVILDTQRYR